MVLLKPLREVPYVSGSIDHVVGIFQLPFRLFMIYLIPYLRVLLVKGAFRERNRNGAQSSNQRVRVLRHRCGNQLAANMADCEEGARRLEGVHSHLTPSRGHRSPLLLHQLRHDAGKLFISAHQISLSHIQIVIVSDGSVAIYGVGPLMTSGNGFGSETTDFTQLVLVEAWYYIVHFSHYAVVVPFSCRYLTLCWCVGAAEACQLYSTTVFKELPHATEGLPDRSTGGGTCSHCVYGVLYTDEALFGRRQVVGIRADTPFK